MSTMKVAPHTKVDSIDELYEIMGTIGKGGFSTVYKGVHKQTGGIRAIKVMDKSILTGKRGTMVARENEILRRCSHANILTLYEVVETKTQLCLILELVSGGDLYDYIVSHKSLTESDAAKITKCILQAVEYLHGATSPVIHRDIKPENVLIEDVEQERVKLSDFGLSKILYDPNSVSCTPGGTSFYLPPEIIAGIKKYGSQPRPSNVQDMKSLDIWSTGVVLYILLCGSPPFRGTINDQAARQALLGQIQQGVSFPPAKWSHITDEAKDLVTQMLQVDPTKRINVRQALAHTWIQQASNAPPVQLQTPSVLQNEYRNKDDFNEQVAGCADYERTELKEKRKQEEAKPVVGSVAKPKAKAKPKPTLKAPGASALLKNRLMGKFEENVTNK
eukprot:TRINITY_DN60526_c0_g2_i1.p1 TRINITY_DN60526_c0_g2~~TRINITY_DN60526_c0_g2_i1.p1  ORF type:complete len:390 (+),score=48.02 TRINITY_DN60526_c0_g2_i1:47-1216(+)